MDETDLTDQQRRLLQRWHDGETTDEESARAEQLVESSEMAASYVEGLDKLGDWVRGAFELADDRVELSAEATVEAAADAEPLVSADLATLTPLLDRFHDGEATATEVQSVERLTDEREDVAEYLERLDRLGDAVRAADQQASSSVDFENFADEIERDIDHAEGVTPGFEPERDAHLVHAFADDELDESRENLVASWIESEDDVGESAEAIEQVGEATRAGFEHATSEVDWQAFRQKLDARLDEHTDSVDEGESADVVPLGRDRASSEPDDERTDSTSFRAWLTTTPGGTIAAAAAAVLLVAVGATLGQFLFGTKQVVEKKVVIVDDVKHDAESSVRVDGPMKQVKQSSKEGDSNESTVIWLLDSDDNDEKGADDPSTDETDGPADRPDRRPATHPDAGATDTGDEDDQPI